MVISLYDPIIAEASRRFNVPESHIRSVMAVESSGRPGSVSPKGASGLMQVMPDTYAELAAKHRLGPDRFDPANNIMAGTAYMRQMYDQFGSWDQAFAAYNAGPGRLQQVNAGARGLPAETRSYVPKVNARIGGDVFQPNIPTLQRPRPGQTVAGPRYIPDNERDLRGLLDLEMPASGNQQDGLGTLTNSGQTPSQPPRPGDPIGGRINELIGNLGKQEASPQMGPVGFMLGGASAAVNPLAAVRDRKVGIGELLGAMGAGFTKGGLGYQQQQQQARSDQFGELGNLIKVQGHQTSQATAARQMEAANAYADQIQNINPALAAALRNNPALMDEVAKAQAAQTFQKDDPTNQHKNAVAMGLIRGTPAYNEYIRASSMPAGSTTLNVGGQEKAEQKAMGEELVKEWSEIRTAGNASENQLRQIEIARRIPLVTGSTAPYFAKVGALAESLGFDRKVLEQFGLGQASGAEAFTGVMNNLVLAKLSEQKGPQTENDALRIQATVASLGNTPEAADFLMGTAAAMAQRNMDRQQFYEQYRAEKGTLDGASSAWRQNIADQPLIGTNPASNRPVFFNEFSKAMREDNPGMTQDRIRQIWAEKYGGRMTPPDAAGQAANAGKAVGTLADFATRYFAQNPSATLDQIRQAWEGAKNGR